MLPHVCALPNLPLQDLNIAKLKHKLEHPDQCHDLINVFAQ